LTPLTTLAEVEVALQTGIEPSEQHNLTWDEVDLTRRFVIISNSKNGSTRRIPLNSVALASLKMLRKRSGGCIFVTIKAELLHVVLPAA